MYRTSQDMPRAVAHPAPSAPPEITPRYTCRDSRAPPCVTPLPAPSTKTRCATPCPTPAQPAQPPCQPNSCHATVQSRLILSFLPLCRDTHRPSIHPPITHPSVGDSHPELTTVPKATTGTANNFLIFNFFLLFLLTLWVAAGLAGLPGQCNFALLPGETHSAYPIPTPLPSYRPTEFCRLPACPPTAQSSRRPCASQSAAHAATTPPLVLPTAVRLRALTLPLSRPPSHD
jgi:hypothetical protein